MDLTLISHHLCPYVQRASIVLSEKGVVFSRRYVDLADKPDWFTAMSPLGKTPVLLVNGDVPVFESAVICEYLDETLTPQLHPRDALERASHRSWMEFGSAVLNTIWAFYTAADEHTLQARREDLQARFMQLEQVLPSSGRYFAGEQFSIVDAVFAPVFRYFDVFEQLGEPHLFVGMPRVREWRVALAHRPSVQQAVGADYGERLTRFLLERNSELSRRIAARGLGQGVRDPADLHAAFTEAFSDYLVPIALSVVPQLQRPDVGGEALERLGFQQQELHGLIMRRPL